MQLGAAINRADFTIAEQAADRQLWEVLAAEARIHVGFAIEPLPPPKAGKQQAGKQVYSFGKSQWPSGRTMHTVCRCVSVCVCVCLWERDID